MLAKNIRLDVFYGNKETVNLHVRRFSVMPRDVILKRRRIQHPTSSTEVRSQVYTASHGRLMCPRTSLIFRTF